MIRYTTLNSELASKTEIDKEMPLSAYHGRRMPRYVAALRSRPCWQIEALLCDNDDIVFLFLCSVPDQNTNTDPCTGDGGGEGARGGDLHPPVHAQTLGSFRGQRGHEKNGKPVDVLLRVYKEFYLCAV